jgi:hypothetical protein
MQTRSTIDECAIALQTIVSPVKAFAALRATPCWRIALLSTIVLDCIGLSLAHAAWWQAIVTVPSLALLQTILAVIVAKWAGGEAPLRSLWAAMVAVSLPGLGIGSLVSGALAAAQTAGGTRVHATMLSLAVLDASPRLHASLAAVTPFSLWQCALFAIAMHVVARLSPVRSVLAGMLMLSIVVAFAALRTH